MANAILSFIRKEQMDMNDFILSAFADEAGESLAAQIAALKRNGLSHMEIRGVDGRPVIDWPEDKLRQIADTLKQNGVAVSSLGSPIGKIGAGGKNSGNRPHPDVQLFHSPGGGSCPV